MRAGRAVNHARAASWPTSGAGARETGGTGAGQGRGGGGRHTASGTQKRRGAAACAVGIVFSRSHGAGGSLWEPAHVQMSGSAWQAPRGGARAGCLPMFMVACRLMTSGDRGFSVVTSRDLRSCRAILRSIICPRGVVFGRAPARSITCSRSPLFLLMLAGSEERFQPICTRYCL